MDWGKGGVRVHELIANANGKLCTKKIKIHICMQIHSIFFFFRNKFIFGAIFFSFDNRKHNIVFFAPKEGPLYRLLKKAK